MPCFEIPITRRGLVLGAAAAALLGSTTPLRAERVRRVLFVCEHGSVKSPIAREHFRRIAARRGIAVRVASRGVNPLEDVTPQLARALAAEGIDPRREPLAALTRADLGEADVVAAFNPIPAALTAGLVLDLRYWLDVPGMNADYAGAKPRMLAHLEALADEFASG